MTAAAIGTAALPRGVRTIWAAAGYDTIYLSGVTAPVIDKTAPAGSVQAYGDTQTQASGALGRLQATLQSLGLSFADVVAAHVFLVGDPGRNGDIDFAGLNAAWSKVFGTADQPNKPARTTVAIVDNNPGNFVEIDAIAAKKPVAVKTKHKKK